MNLRDRMALIRAGRGIGKQNMVRAAVEWWVNKTVDEDHILITERHDRPAGGWPFVPVFSGHRNPQMAETFGGEVPISKLEDPQL